MEGGGSGRGDGWGGVRVDVNGEVNFFFENSKNKICLGDGGRV